MFYRAIVQLHPAVYRCDIFSFPVSLVPILSGSVLDMRVVLSKHFFAEQQPDEQAAGAE
jgi:hypothetical protein